MSDLINAEYFAGRALIARELSKSSINARAAEAHANLAEQYEALAKDFEPHRPGHDVIIPMKDQAQAQAQAQA